MDDSDIEERSPFISFFRLFSVPTTASPVWYMPPEFVCFYCCSQNSVPCKGWLVGEQHVVWYVSWYDTARIDDLPNHNHQIWHSDNLTRHKYRLTQLSFMTSKALYVYTHKNLRSSPEQSGWITTTEQVNGRVPELACWAVQYLERMAN